MRKEDSIMQLMGMQAFVTIQTKKRKKIESIWYVSVFSRVRVVQKVQSVGKRNDSWKRLLKNVLIETVQK
jgi:hypothetical protein